MAAHSLVCTLAKISWSCLSSGSGHEKSGSQILVFIGCLFFDAYHTQLSPNKTSTFASYLYNRLLSQESEATPPKAQTPINAQAQYCDHHQQPSGERLPQKPPTEGANEIRT